MDNFDDKSQHKNIKKKKKRRSSSSDQSFDRKLDICRSNKHKNRKLDKERIKNNETVEQKRQRRLMKKSLKVFLLYTKNKLVLKI